MAKVTARTKGTSEIAPDAPGFCWPNDAPWIVPSNSRAQIRFNPFRFPQELLFVGSFILPLFKYEKAELATLRPKRRSQTDIGKTE
jgi:hypothetical protein